MTFVRRGGRKVIAAPDGDPWPPSRPRPDEALIRAVVRAHRWRRLLEQKKYRSVSELAEAGDLTRSFVNRLLRLTLLAPNIVEAILDGRQPKGLQLEDVTRAMPITWDEQRQRFSDDRWTAAEELRLHFVRALDGEKATAVNRRDSPGTHMPPTCGRGLLSFHSGYSAVIRCDTASR